MRHVLAKRGGGREGEIVRGGLWRALLSVQENSTNCHYDMSFVRGLRRSPRQAREAQAPSPSVERGRPMSLARYFISPEQRAGADDHGMIERGFILVYDPPLTCLRHAAEERQNRPAKAA